ncbi:MAG: hypothetical protein WBC33_06885, partial [Conexibacter sp.]
VRRGRVVELDATLDLREPANHAAVRRLLAALRDPRHLGRRIRALGVRIARGAQLDRRIYALRTDAAGVGAKGGAGVELGGAFERTTRALRLLSAETRLPGLPFLPRDDCRPG